MGYQQTSLYIMDIDGNNVKKYLEILIKYWWKEMFKYDDKEWQNFTNFIVGKVKDIVDELGVSTGRPYSWATQFQEEEDMHLLMEMYIIHLI